MERDLCRETRVEVGSEESVNWIDVKRDMLSRYRRLLRASFRTNK